MSTTTAQHDAGEPATINFGELLDPLGDGALEQAEHGENTELHFKDEVGMVRVIRRIAEALSVEYADEFAPQKLKELRDALKSVGMLVKQMVDFSVQQPGADNQHKQLKQQVTQQHGQWINNFRPLVRGAMPTGPLLSDLGRARAESAELLEQLHDVHQRHEAQIERAETLAAETAAAELSKYYEDQAVAHKNASRTYLKAALATGIGLAIAAGIMLFTLGTGTGVEWPTYVRDLTVRLFVLGLGVYAINFTVRGFRSNEHLRVINEHKANALKTYLLFQASTDEDPDARAMITAELVKAVFSSEQTGFLDNAPDTQVLDGQSSVLTMLLSQRSKT